MMNRWMRAMISLPLITFAACAGIPLVISLLTIEAGGIAVPPSVSSVRIERGGMVVLRGVP